MRKQKNKKQWTKKTKILVGVFVSLGILVLSFFTVLGSRKSNDPADAQYRVEEIKEGSILSSTLLTGKVSSSDEQYVYYESAKGELVSVNVSVGDQVEAGQVLVQYDSTVAQTAYDQAIRGYNKVSRQLYDFQTYGVYPSAIETGEYNEEGLPLVDNSAQRSYQSQLNDLNDALANAQGTVSKTEAALNDTVIYSKIAGTVVEVNTSVNPSAAANSSGQVLVHIVSQGQQQVKGKVTEYDLANVRQDQDVKITSKAFPDKEWTGKIAYVSNYPEAPASADANGSNQSSYPYKINFTSDPADLKQGFKVNVELINTNKYPLVNLSAIKKDGKKNYVWVYDDSKGTIQRADVTLGSADAKQQEVTAGLNVGQLVVEKPSKSFKNGDKIETKNAHQSKKNKEEGK